MLSKEKGELFRKIPAVDSLLNSPELTKISSNYPRSLILRAINQVLAKVREDIQKIDPSENLGELKFEEISKKVVDRLQSLSLSSLKTVINATGVIVHTNLGRSLLADKVIKRFRPMSEGYSNLEYDLGIGKRGSRYSHVEGILKEITSAEAAMVVNNNAAAVLVSLDTLAKGREVIVSRGQLVEIGGSFRVPDVMGKSGAHMVEVGTTNKTHLWDYEEKIGPDTALLLKVHQSNFQIVGFTEEVQTPELVTLSKKYGIPLMEDLGSGCLVDLSQYGLLKEPTVQEVLADGVDLVTFSGDKLLGGPQAGIILGRKDLVEAIKKNQLSRALRIDKLTLLALEETLKIYRDERAAINEIPTLEMICRPYEDLDKKARELSETVAESKTGNYILERRDGHSRIGGGALPLQELRTRLLCLIPKKFSAQEMEGWLRSYNPPIIVRIENDQILLDLRTIRDQELKTVAQALKKLASA